MLVCVQGLFFLPNRVLIKEISVKAELATVWYLCKEFCVLYERRYVLYVL